MKTDFEAIHFARVHAKAAAMEHRERKKYLENNTNYLALTRATMNHALGLRADF